MIIDGFSKYGWGIPLKYKDRYEPKRSLQKIIKKSKPKNLWVDSGKEFYNKKVEKLLQDNNIVMYATHNDENCSWI